MKTFRGEMRMTKAPGSNRKGALVARTTPMAYEAALKEQARLMKLFPQAQVRIVEDEGGR